MLGIKTTTLDYTQAHGPKEVRVWWLGRFSVMYHPRWIENSWREGTLSIHWHWKTLPGRIISGFIFSCLNRKLYLQYHHKPHPVPYEETVAEDELKPTWLVSET